MSDTDRLQELAFDFYQRYGLLKQIEKVFRPPGGTYRVLDVGGHTAGLQVVRVKTARGWVVLAADASHFYANFEQMRAYPTVYNVGDMLEGFATVRRLATSLQHVVPGHDPLVFARYPAAKPGLKKIAARLDVPAKG